MTYLSSSKRWNVHPPQEALSRRLAQEAGISPILAQILINRGVRHPERARDFLHGGPGGFHDPFVLKDMDAAVTRIRLARDRGERILIYGDYDVDGITSIAVLQRSLEKMGLDVVHYIPHRIHDGYGMNRAVGKIARDRGAHLFISVDCGITAVQEVEILNRAGVDVIIIDHHEVPADGLPGATAVIDPKRRDDGYPFKELAAVGLVMKLVHALKGGFDESDLDLVALGTIADVVPLTGENRAIVKRGLTRIAHTQNVGLAALMEVAKITGKTVRPKTVGFILGPRLNATGRMDTARRSLELLLSEDRAEALRLAADLNHFNLSRQKIQRQILSAAVDLVEKEVNFKEQHVIVLSQAGWHKGVLGIVAARIAEKYSRPTIIISLDEGVGSASARSLEGFHLVEALEHCADLLVEFGGHRMAAGLTIRESEIQRFRDHINDFARKIIPQTGLQPSLAIEGDIPLGLIQSGFIQELDQLEPFGEGNPVPLFCSRGLTVKGRPQIRARETLKFWVTDGRSVMPVIGFGMARYADMITAGSRIDIVYHLEINEWKGISSIQLNLKDLRSSQE